MKRLLITVFAALSVLTAPAWARDWQTIQASGKLHAITEGAFYPFNYFEGQTLTGFEVELAEAIAKELGLAIEWRTVPFDAQIAAIQQGRYDFAIASHGYTEQRAKAVDFTNPHYCTGGMIAARKDGPLTVKALAGKTVAVQIGTSYLENARKIPGLKALKTYKSDPEAFAALTAGKVDAWISDRFLVKATLEKNGDPNLAAGEQVFYERVSMILQKNNPELKEKLNEGLAAIMRNGVYQRLSQKYFGEDVSCPE